MDLFDVFTKEFEFLQFDIGLGRCVIDSVTFLNQFEETHAVHYKLSKKI